MKKHIIFDLDGTLIDSAPSILECFSLAFEKTGIPMMIPLTNAVIGPPLKETLIKLSGTQDNALLQQLADAFKQSYDQVGYSKAVVYKGIPSLLDHLSKHYDLYIATNKRYLPTQKIMQYLQWQPYFKGSFSLDFYQPALQTKSDMVRRIVQDFSLNVDECIYIGDRQEDGTAAENNGMDFIWVTWGYTDIAVLNQNTHWQKCEHVESLAGKITNASLKL